MPDSPYHPGETIQDSDGPTFVLPVRIYYEDTDAGGIVYYANYLKYAERARSEMLRPFGFESNHLQEDCGMAIAVRHVEADYQRPAKLDDLLHVYSKLIKIGGASLAMTQTIKRGDEVMVEIAIKLVCINLEKGRAERIPSHVRATLTSHCLSSQV